MLGLNISCIGLNTMVCCLVFGVYESYILSDILIQGAILIIMIGILTKDLSEICL